MLSITLISILGGLGGMVGWGSSDFLANLAADKVGHTKTFFWSQVAGLALILLVLLASMPAVALSPLLLGLLIFTGVVYTFGYLFFYAGFEVGNVSVVSAVINVQTLFIVGIALLQGQGVTVSQAVALALLLLGVMLVSVNFKELFSGTVSLTKGVKETLIAAILFGVFFWPLNEYLVEQVDWLLVTGFTKVIALATISLLSIFQRKSLSVVVKKNTKLLIILAGVGVLEAVGVMGANFGMAYGNGVIVAPIASALTIVTVGLAMVFLKEKITRYQAVGIGLTIVGIILAAF